MVSTVKTDRTRSHNLTRGLVGRSLEKEVMTDASLYMIGWGAGFQCMIGVGVSYAQSEWVFCKRTEFNGVALHLGVFQGIVKSLEKHYGKVYRKL